MASPSSLFSSMSKFSFRRRDKDFKHIAPGLVPSASIAPKPAVPRTPPPRSPNPSPERTRSALAAAILSSSLTGRTFAIPPAGPRSLSAADRSLSFSGLPQGGSAAYQRGSWSEFQDRRPHLMSPGVSDDEEEAELHYEEEGEVEEEVEREELSHEELSDEELHIYQTLDRPDVSPICLDRDTAQPFSLHRHDSQQSPEPVYARPLKAKRVLQEEANSDEESAQQSVSSGVRGDKPIKQQKSQMPDRRDHAQDHVTMETREPSLKAGHGPSKKKPPTRRTSEPNETLRRALEVHQQAVASLKQQNAALSSERRLLQQTVRRQRQELLRGPDTTQDHILDPTQDHRLDHDPRLSREQASPLVPRGAQEEVEEVQNLKLTVHRLSVELSRYQAQYRPLGQGQSSGVEGLPMTSSPPPWLSDMKYLSPLLLAYEDRMAEKDTLLQAVQKEVAALRVHVEEVVTENQTLHGRLLSSKAVSQQDWCSLQERAALVLKENRVLLEQLGAQQEGSRISQIQHQTEVSGMREQLMLTEEKNRLVQEKLEEAQTELRTMRRRMKDAVTWEEHCDITGRLHRQLEEEERRRVKEVEDMHVRVSCLEEEKKVVKEQNSALTLDHRTKKQELQLSEQACRKACARQAVLGGQLKVCLRQEQEARLLLTNLLTLAQRSTLERDHLALLASALEHEKEGGFRSVLEGNLRLRKLQDKIQVYRGRASAGQARAERRQREQEAALARSQREIVGLQQQLGDRQSALDTLLQSKQELEEELGVVWEAATREEQGMRETLLNSPPGQGLQDLGPLCRTPTPDWLSSKPSELPTLNQAHRRSEIAMERLGLDFYS